MVFLAFRTPNHFFIFFFYGLKIENFVIVQLRWFWKEKKKKKTKGRKRNSNVNKEHICISKISYLIDLYYKIKMVPLLRHGLMMQ